MSLLQNGTPSATEDMEISQQQRSSVQTHHPVTQKGLVAPTSPVFLPPASPDLPQNGLLKSSSPSLKAGGISGVQEATSSEFPFTASPGETGVSPTNDLVHRIDYATSKKDKQKERARFDDTETPSPHTNGAPVIRQPDSGFNTPPRRKSVQFARSGYSDPSLDTMAARLESRENEDNDDQLKKSRSARAFSRLKAFASPGHVRSLSWTMESTDPESTSRRDRERERQEEEDYADAEESGNEAPVASSRPKSKRKSRRKKEEYDGSSTAPTTPRALKFPSFRRTSYDRASPPTSPPSRPPTTARYTMSDIPENNRLAFSDDEGQNNRTSRSRTKRPSGLRRITGMVSSSKVEQVEPISPSPWRRGERMSSTSALKWKQLKAGLKFMSSKKREETRLDHAKSAELVAELLAGAPAALMMASMFLRDEHGRKRIPILMEQLKVKVTDSIPAKNDADERHLTFRIELEYGSAPQARLKWIIHRTWRDFARLHYKYKVQTKSDNFMHFHKDNFELPKFPRGAVPYLRKIRGLYEGEENDDDDLTAGEQTAGEQTAGEQSGFEGNFSGTDRPNMRKRRPSLNFVKRTASAFGSLSGSGNLPTTAESYRKDTYNDKIRKRIELYLQQMINTVIFRPISNRLCKFLEISALGVRLGPEGGYHGKEGYMMIKSSKGVDFRKKLTPRLFVDRHSPKWFLVRPNYIACVDSPDSSIIYDVFLVDPYFNIEKKRNILADKDDDDEPLELSVTRKTYKSARHHQLKITNSESVTTLLVKNERLLRQFEDSIKFMLDQTEWSKPHRYQSFAPVRQNVWAQFLVDGQDYMWNVSRAVANARDVIFIHDWWLSPEVFLRRPPAISQDWRLDRLLKRKADEGVKIFVIVYRNIESAIPISSDHTKSSLMALGDNVIIQRSPNQMRQNTFFWAHHEKVLVVDHTVAFCGGVDLCFGRWDTPEHRLNDDNLTGYEEQDFPRDSDNCQLWPGKDYSNPRVQDFFTLDRPYDEMYDRTKVPRMPWHDVGMQIVGQPARDLSRHFVQRWNFLLRQRDSHRARPMLLPPPDFLPEDLKNLNLTGSCEVQILRSASEWSLGTMGRVEHSIMDAYVDTIRDSEHLVYMENQFFITSCQVESTKIENKIGDALVERIIRAHENNERWRAIIVIPLVPGFQSTVDAMDGSSVRLIMECQYYSISHGETSIFGRLRKFGIDPRKYIDFYALRSWGRIGPDKTLVTEQLYIHAKIMIVDDRIAIIGSANVNERSMLGSRDSEIAAIVQDKDFFPSRMAGREYLVSRFAHEFRLRLMREHLGLDIARHSEIKTQKKPAAAREPAPKPPSNVFTERHIQNKLNMSRAQTQASILSAERSHQERVAESSIYAQFDGTSDAKSESTPLPPHPAMPRLNTADLGLPYPSQLPQLPDIDDTDIGGPPIFRDFSSRSGGLESHPDLASLKLPLVTRTCMIDPVSDGFFREVWHRVAENNTQLFRSVFRCMPDNKVKTWDDYYEYDTFYERFKNEQQGDLSKADGVVQATQEKSDTVAAAPTTNNGDQSLSEKAPLSEKPTVPENETNPISKESPGKEAPSNVNANARRNQSKRRRRADTKASMAKVDIGGQPVMLDRKVAEEVCQQIQGHLVVWPYDWLKAEREGGRWKNAVDQLAPLEIYS